MVEEYYVNNDTGLTKMSTDVLVKIANLKVDSTKATDPTTALIIFVYDTEYKHNIFQLCVYRNQSEDHGLIWRPFINNELGPIFRNELELREFVGGYLYVEVSDDNLHRELEKLVEENKITEKEFENIKNGGIDPNQQDPKMLQEFAKEQVSKDPTVTALPSVLAGYGMPGSNPYLNQYNQEVLAGKDAPPVLTNDQVIERMNDGKLKRTKSGIYLLPK